MTLNFTQLQTLINALTSLKGEKLPFKVSLIIAKNLSILQKEFEFYAEQERTFAQTYIEFDENGQPVQSGENMYKIKPGMEEECTKARMELNEFTCEPELRQIPISAIENLELTPEQVSGIELILNEEE